MRGSLVGLSLLPLVCSAGIALAYPGGTPEFVTDIAPFCASCHSSLSGAQFANVPEARVAKELVQGKHIASIRAAREGTAYAKLTSEQREQLIEGIQKIDAASSVELLAPAKVAAGQIFEATIEATGGGGPVVGLALVDSNQRWQARPAASAGWSVISTPTVRGPDGQPQTRFTERRNPALAPGLSYVNIYGVSADPTQDRYERVSVTFQLRAPALAGEYPLAALFLYGTEKASPHGAVETLRGKVPVGGYSAHSGRIRFSEIRRIVVE